MSTRQKSSLDPTQPSSPSSIPKENTALLICDFQNLTLSFFDSDTTARARIVNTAAQLRTWALASTIPVYHCIVDTKLPAVLHARISERWERYATKLRDIPQLGDIAPELSPSTTTDSPENEQIFSRPPGLVSALSSPDLLSDLSQRSIRSLVVVGLSTSGCVLSTVRDANEKGFVTTVVEDGCADPAVGVHDILVTNVLPMTAHVVGGWKDVVRIFEH